MNLRELIAERVRTDGPLTFAEYMELALYHPALGYYARAAQRSGRAGDYFTSVDVGPLFGRLLAVQFTEMWAIAGDGAAAQFDLVEAGAGNGQLSRDVLDALSETPPLYEVLRLHLVERSASARAAQPATLGPHATKIASRGEELPGNLTGVIFANELLDALPAHRVVMTADGLREVYVDCRNGRLAERRDHPSTPELEQYLLRLGTRLQEGACAEINLAALSWIERAAQRLRTGFLLLVDYGDDAERLFGAARRHGTLAAYRRHVQADASSEWLDEPGDWDLTTDVDLTSLIHLAEGLGLQCLGALDQTYFLLGLGPEALARETAGDGVGALKRRLAAKTLLLPSGLGSTHKVLIFGKSVGSPALRGCSYRQRRT